MFSFRRAPTVAKAWRGAAAARGGSSSVTITRARVAAAAPAGVGRTAWLSWSRVSARSMALRGSGPSEPEAVPVDATTATRQAKSARRRTSTGLADPRREAPRGPEAFEHDGGGPPERLPLGVLGDQPRADDGSADDLGRLRAKPRRPRAADA